MGGHRDIPEILYSSGLHCKSDGPCSSSGNLHGSQVERDHGLEARVTVIGIIVINSGFNKDNFELQILPKFSISTVY